MAFWTERTVVVAGGATWRQVSLHTPLGSGPKRIFGRVSNVPPPGIGSTAAKVSDRQAHRRKRVWRPRIEGCHYGG